MKVSFLPITRYALKTLHHKYYVFRFGLKTGASLWRLLKHDWVKFTPSELPYYANRFYGKNDDQLGFAHAWNHHHKRQDHHWEYWIPTSAHSKSPVPGGEPLPMPEAAIREMVADWLAASTVYVGIVPTSIADWKWFQREKKKIRLHPDSWIILDQVMSSYFARKA
jgi:hypothetical protein